VGGGGGNGVDGGGEESLNPFTGIGDTAEVPPIIDCIIAEGPSVNCWGANGVDGGGGGSLSTLPEPGSRGGFSRTGGTNAGSAGASWNFSIVIPDGEKYRNPTNPTTNNAAITNNIDNRFAIFYL
jgi:hypothetical protein